MKNEEWAAIGARVREVRQSKGYELTLAEFGERLGVKGQTISTIELGTGRLTETMKRLICLEFGVNRRWLETGEGEMFVGMDIDNFQKMAATFSSDEKITLMSLWNFEPSIRATLIERLRMDIILFDQLCKKWHM